MGQKFGDFNIMIRVKFRRLPSAISHMTQCLKYWVRLLQMETHRYPKQCYEMLRSFDSLGTKTWASDIKCMLFTFGFGYVKIA